MIKFNDILKVENGLISYDYITATMSQKLCTCVLYKHYLIYASQKSCKGRIVSLLLQINKLRLRKITCTGPQSYSVMSLLCSSIHFNVFFSRHYRVPDSVWQALEM